MIKAIEQSRKSRVLDIGGSYIVAADIDTELVPLDVTRIRTPCHDFDEFCLAIESLLGNDTAPVGIAIPALLHPVSGQATSANIPCINNRSLAAELSMRFARDIHLINDANAFALAEATVGSGAGHSVVFAAILGTGVGGALVVEGRLLTGAHGTAGEWGHSPATTLHCNIELPLARCGCGQLGCIDTLGSARGLERLYRHLAGKSLDSIDILHLWQNGDAIAQTTLKLYIDIVGGALAMVVNLLGPSIIPVGGGLANDISLIQALDAAVRARTLFKYDQPLLVAASQGPEPGLIGAAIHVNNTLQHCCDQ